MKKVEDVLLHIGEVLKGEVRPIPSEEAGLGKGMQSPDLSLTGFEGVTEVNSRTREETRGDWRDEDDPFIPV